MEKDNTLISIAAKQGGVVRRKQVLDVGLSAGAIRRRLASGRWKRTVNGAYQLFPAESELDRLRAAVAILPTAVVSHSSACRLYGVDRAGLAGPTVLVHSKTTHSFPGVSVVRCHDLLDTHVTTIDDLPVTTPARTVCDLAGELVQGVVARVLDSFLTDRLVTIENVDVVLHDVARRGKPGVAVLRKLIAERVGQDHTGSVLEARANKLLLDAFPGGIEFEYPIPWDTARRFDVAFPSHRLAIEWDSRAWHTQLGAIESDRRRDRDAIVRGWRVLRFTWTDVNDRPSYVVATIAAVLG